MMIATKPTVLDHLTSPTVTPEILRVRASYWTTVADRNQRNGREAQAWRIRRNCAALRMQAQAMEHASVVSIVAPSPKTALVVPKTTRTKLTFRGYADFQSAYLTAKMAALRVYGERWYLVPHACVKARVPASWTHSVVLGRASKTPRDLNIPAGEFWPSGALPYGPEYAVPSNGLRPRVTVTSLVTGQRAELYDIELPGWFAIQEAIGKKLMKHPRIAQSEALAA